MPSSHHNPWAFSSSTHQDSWISDVFSSETQTLTKALHRSFLGSDSDSDAMASFLDLITPPEPATASGEPKPQRSSIPASGGKGVSKRKSRASKRSHTTFITADPANFRQMVQQVTGVRFGNSQVQIPPVLKPEPQRPGGLPTLDTSAFLLKQQQQQQQSSGIGSEMSGRGGPVSYGPDLDTFSSFPTLESWKAVM